MSQDPNSAWDSVLRVDAAVQDLQAEIRDQIVTHGKGGVVIPDYAGFDFDSYFATVKRWNEYRAGVERRKVWFFWPVDTIDECNGYWTINALWRERAEKYLGITPRTGPQIAPEKPLPANDPRRTNLPYERTLNLGIAAALILGIGYLVSKAT